MNKCEYCNSENVKLNTKTNEFVCIECASVQPEKYMVSNDTNNETKNRSYGEFEEKYEERIKRNVKNVRFNALIKNQYRIGFYQPKENMVNYYKWSISNLIKSFNFDKTTSYLIYHTFMNNLNLIKKSNDRNLLICACIYVIRRNLLTFVLFRELHISKQSKHLIFEYVRLIQK